MFIGPQRIISHKQSGDQAQGFVLVLVLMVLVVLSLMGGAAMLMRNTEQQLISNVEIFDTNFYAAETIAVEGATTIENTDDSILLQVASLPTWLQPDNDTGTLRLLLTHADQWPNASITPAETSFTSGDRKITPTGYSSDGTSAKDRLRYAAVQGNLRSDTNSYDICTGSNLSDETKVEKCYTVYGMYDVKSGTDKAYSGRKLLMLGYRKTLYYPN